MFPFGNLGQMTRKKNKKFTVASKNLCEIVSHDIHATVSPFYARWQNIYGNFFKFVLLSTKIKMFVDCN